MCMGFLRVMCPNSGPSREGPSHRHTLRWHRTRPDRLCIGVCCVRMHWVRPRVGVCECAPLVHTPISIFMFVQIHASASACGIHARIRARACGTLAHAHAGAHVCTHLQDEPWLHAVLLGIMKARGYGSACAPTHACLSTTCRMHMHAHASAHPCARMCMVQVSWPTRRSIAVAIRF